MSKEKMSAEKERMMQYREEDINKMYAKDITSNWATSSKFLFYSFLLLIVIYLLSASVALNEHSYKSNKQDKEFYPSIFSPKYKY